MPADTQRDKESPGIAGASSLGMKHTLEAGETSRQPDSIPKRVTRNEKRLRNAAIVFSYRHYVAAYLASRVHRAVPPLTRVPQWGRLVSTLSMILK